MTPESLRITVGEERVDESFAVPVDSLGELPPLESGFMRYTVEQNTFVTIGLGNESWQVRLFPDIAALIFQLVAPVDALQSGAAAALPFPESQLDLSFEPGDRPVTEAVMQAYGASSRTSRHLVDRAQVVAELRRFARDVFDRAEASGYVHSGASAAYLARLDP